MRSTIEAEHTDASTTADRTLPAAAPSAIPDDVIETEPRSTSMSLSDDKTMGDTNAEEEQFDANDTKSEKRPMSAQAAPWTKEAKPNTKPSTKAPGELVDSIDPIERCHTPQVEEGGQTLSGTATTVPRPKQKAGNFKAGFKLAKENAAMIAKYGRVAEWAEDDDDDDDNDNDDTDSITEDDGGTVM